MDRRTVLALTGVIAVAALAAEAQPMSIKGTVDFEGGAPIPEGELRVFIEGTEAQAATARGTDGLIPVEAKASTANFEIAAPPAARSAAAAPIQVVATLQRADGHLLARGSNQVTDGEPVRITLYTVMY